MLFLGTSSSMERWCTHCMRARQQQDAQLVSRYSTYKQLAGDLQRNIAISHKVK